MTRLAQKLHVVSKLLLHISCQSAIGKGGGYSWIYSL